MQNPFYKISCLETVSLTSAQESIHNAYITLLRQYDYNSLPVTALCETAHIARSTFYVYYQNTDDVLIQIENRLINQLLQSRIPAENSEIQTTTYEIFHFIMTNRTMISLFVTERPNYRFIEKLKCAIKYSYWEQLFRTRNAINGEIILEVVASVFLSLTSSRFPNTDKINTHYLQTIIQNILQALDYDDLTTKLQPKTAIRNSFNTDLKSRVKAYWTMRSQDFLRVRRNELKAKEIGKLWMETICRYLPDNRPGLKILDAGTGVGYFAILTALQGYQTTGIDITPAMLAHAKELSSEFDVSPIFKEMDAQELDFDDNTFDAVISRDLTWTLPDVPKAYQQWYRVLRPGGVMINFDACYGENIRYEKSRSPLASPDSPFGHPNLSEKTLQENAAITFAMEASHRVRPGWDLTILAQCGFRQFGTDINAGQYIRQQWDLMSAPMFLIWAKK